jgi:hypothetical protein
VIQVKKVDKIVPYIMKGLHRDELARKLVLMLRRQKSFRKIQSGASSLCQGSLVMCILR